MARTQVFRHMMPRDIPPFCSFLLSPEGQQFTSWEFDVIVGEPEDPGALYDLNKRRQAMYLNALKIDAIGWFFNTPTLIEAKPDADIGAIGQIDSYADWYRMLYGVMPAKMIVCNAMRRQVQTVCQWHDIQVRIFQDASPLDIQTATAYILPKIKASPLFPNPLVIPRS